MLNALSVRNIVLIDQLDLTLEDGLTALTGETGAGKSILLDALTLALGGRGDASLVRAGAESGQVVAVLQLPRHHPAREALRENAIADDEDIILRRVQLADGRTRFTVAQAGSFDPGRRFDVIVFNQSLYYLPDPAAILTRYRQFLARDVRFIISMVDSPRSRAAWRQVRRVLRVEDEMITIQNKGKVVTAVLLPD